MTAERVTQLFLLGWLVAFAGSFIAFALTPSRDFGLAAGWNRVSVFMGWQVFAMLTAFGAGVASRRVRKGKPLRWIGVVPVGIFTLMALAVVALILWANLQRPAPDTGAPLTPTPTRPVTAPAVDQ